MKKTFLTTLFLLLLSPLAFAQADKDPAASFYRMTEVAPAAYNKGDFETAKATSIALLVEAESWRKNWNYGNAIHVANLVLGRIELAAGDKKKAREYLVAAGRTPGSPQLNSFGPDMLFAKEMLAAGETGPVLEYLDLCAKFWEKKETRLDDWKAQIKKGETPDFGANLRYHF